MPKGWEHDESESAGTAADPSRPSPPLIPDLHNGGGSLLGEEDSSLVRRCRAGDQQAFAELCGRFQGKVFRMLDRMASWPRETVEDLVQEVFLRVFRGLPSFQGEAGLSTWIHRIAVNVGISALRARSAAKRNRPTLSLDAARDALKERGRGGFEPAAPDADPSEALCIEESAHRIREAIASLPPLWNLVLTLRDLEGRSYEEIGEILGLPPGTVRSRLHRARSRVRELLDGRI